MAGPEGKAWARDSRPAFVKAAAGAGQPGNQVLLTNTLPSRVLHLLRTHPVGLTMEFCEELQAMLQEAVLSIMDVPSLTAVQWDMAFVPLPQED